VGCSGTPSKCKLPFYGKRVHRTRGLSAECTQRRPPPPRRLQRKCCSPATRSPAFALPRFSPVARYYGAPLALCPHAYFRCVMLLISENGHEFSSCLPPARYAIDYPIEVPVPKCRHFTLWQRRHCCHPSYARFTFFLAAPARLCRVVPSRMPDSSFSLPPFDAEALPDAHYCSFTATPFFRFLPAAFFFFRLLMLSSRHAYLRHFMRLPSR